MPDASTQPNVDGPPASIEHLPELVASLPDASRMLVERLFQIVATEGVLLPPPEMLPWLEHTFGSVAAVRHQRIIRVTNRWTFEGTTFNPLRSQRPASGVTQRARQDDTALHERIAQSAGDDFCDPLHKTPADSFGRVLGRHMVTASNVAKADGWHGVGVFDRHDPLAIDAALVADVLAVGGEWAARAHALDPAARHLFLFWNCLWRAGASQTHGHVQMTLSREMAHARVELLRAAASRYHHETGRDYFADLVAAHRALGLTAPPNGDVERFASLTPVKEREVVLLAANEGASDVAWQRRFTVLAAPLWQTLRVALEHLGVRAFNVAVYGPPYDLQPHEPWTAFPFIARFVDRGNPLSTTADIAALELFGSSVVASDPFDVARTLR